MLKTLPLERLKAGLPGALLSWRLVVTLAAVYLAVAGVPAAPGPIAGGLDASWVIGLSAAHAGGLVHGRDIVFTWGPLTYLVQPETGSGARWLVLLYRLGAYAVWCAALLRVAFLAANWLGLWMVGLIGAAALIDPYFCSDHVPLATFTWALVAVMDRSKWRVWALAAVAFLSAVACLTKLNQGIAASCLFAAVMVVAILQDVPRAKAIKWQLLGVVLLLPVSMVVLYAAETGSVAPLWAYLSNGIDIASGYSEEMAVNGPYGQALLAVLSMVLLFAVMPLIDRPVRNIAPAILPALAYAFFSFKGGMVRQDAHAANVQLLIALAALFLLAAARTDRFKYAAMAFQAACVVCSYYYIAESWPGTGGVVESRLSVAGNLRAIGAFANWPKTWADLDRESRQNLAVLRVSKDLDSVVNRKAVEAIPWDVARIKANGWNWRPRPVFQTYAAYTPRLDRINSEHLKSARAADFALVDWGAIDGRHPLVDTPLQWRTQLDLYETATTESEELLLARRPSPRFQGTQPVSSEKTGWGGRIRVPQSPDPVILSARIERTLTARLRSFLFRSNPFWIEVRRQSGRTERYRGLRSNFAGGVILNHLPDGLGDLALLATAGCVPSDPVVSLQFLTDAPDEFKPDISLEWSRLLQRAEPAGNCVQITATEASYPVWGGIGLLAVTGGAGTAWTGTANQPWIVIQSGASGTAKGIVHYLVGKSSGPASRQGTISVGSRRFRVVQRGPEETPGRLTLQLGFYRKDDSGEPPPAPLTGVDLLIDRFEGFAEPGDQVVMGDWTGNGVMRLGAFRDGDWRLDLNGNRRWDGEKGGDGKFSFGLPGDIAAPGDWVGDGRTRFGILRNGQWAFDSNGNMKWDRTDRFTWFGIPGDIPVVGKWSHDRADRIGIFRNGWWIVDSNGDGEFQRTDDRFNFGLGGDIPLVSLAGDQVGVYRGGTCILDRNGDRTYDRKDLMTGCGNKGDTPIVAAW